MYVAPQKSEFHKHCTQGGHWSWETLTRAGLILWRWTVSL